MLDPQSNVLPPAPVFGQPRPSQKQKPDLAYVIEAEMATRGEDVADAWIDALAPWHGVVAAGPTGNLVTVITPPAEDLRQETATGLAFLAQSVDEQVLAVTVQTEGMRDERAAWVPVPELVSAGEAADRLGVSRQRVLAADLRRPAGDRTRREGARRAHFGAGQLEGLTSARPRPRVDPPTPDRVRVVLAQGQGSPSMLPVSTMWSARSRSLR